MCPTSGFCRRLFQIHLLASRYKRYRRGNRSITRGSEIGLADFDRITWVRDAEGCRVCFPCPRALSRTANAAEIARSHWLLPCRGVGDGYVQVRRSCSTEVCARSFSHFPASSVQPVKPGRRSRQEEAWDSFSGTLTENQPKRVLSRYRCCRQFLHFRTFSLYFLFRVCASA